MNKDQVAGKVKDLAGRVERQAGEWTGDKEKQAHGALKQVEGKVQNAWGNAKDAVDKHANTKKEEADNVPAETEEEGGSRRKAS